MELKARFFKLVSSYSKDEYFIQSLWKNIYKNYSEPNRTYHNLTHLEELFKHVDVHQNLIKNLDLLSFSVFYHDIIYNIWNTDNEEKSAEFAMESLSKLKLNQVFLDQLNNQIYATKTHISSDDDTKWLLDFDLGILGTSTEHYANYTALIREEYKSIPEFTYINGRKKVLQHFIDKPFIYNSDVFKTKYEKQAKLNLTNELNLL